MTTTYKPYGPHSNEIPPNMVTIVQELPAEDRSLAAYLLEKKINDTLEESETLRSKFWTKSTAGYKMKDSIHEFKKRAVNDTYLQSTNQDQKSWRKWPRNT
ncbi:hypothetical protein B0H14DRAFT_2588116 [Mycena olivaceomarginata]|nr:hypothetical protein B0H14DRAFT_2588116 [Mycena olivaceomarginata]